MLRAVDEVDESMPARISIALACTKLAAAMESKRSQKGFLRITCPSLSARYVLDELRTCDGSRIVR